VTESQEKEGKRTSGGESPKRNFIFTKELTQHSGRTIINAVCSKKRTIKIANSMEEFIK